MRFDFANVFSIKGLILPPISSASPQHSRGKNKKYSTTISNYFFLLNLPQLFFSHISVKLYTAQLGRKFLKITYKIKINQNTIT